MSEIIRRKLDEAKKEIARMESMNNTQKVEKTTRSIMPPIRSQRTLNHHPTALLL